MKISLNSIKYMAERYKTGADPTAIGVAAVVERIGAQLGAVEEVVEYGNKFEGVVIARVVSCSDHPQADRLHVCMLDDGGVVAGVERNADGQVQVVCGAPNVRAGLTVVWLPPGSTVPESVGKDPFVLGARALRGVVSNGMLASPRELTIGDSHEGILEVDGNIASGTPFVDAFELRGDAIIDIENKMFTHRPDCFGFMGVARELAGIQGLQFTSPDWYMAAPEIPVVEADGLPLSVTVDAPDVVPRFTAIAMRGVRVGSSPVWLQVELAKHGLRPINNIVDLTNFFMLETGQPLHAYDYDKVLNVQSDAKDGVQLGARLARAGEKLELLNGKTVTLQPTDIVITGGDTPIGLGGVMGGGNTEVDDNTRNIIIEVATFDMYAIRRTSMHHGLFSDAVTRFNKGQSPLQNLAVLAKMAAEVQQSAGGTVASALCDVRSDATTQRIQAGSVHAPVRLTTAFINERLGLCLSAEQMKTTLQNVEFRVSVTGDELTVTAPFWRTDIEIAEDVVEEVGRLYGYDQLPLDLPLRSLKPAARNELLDLKQRLRTVLAKSGANEVLTYSFVHGNLLQKVGQDSARAFQIGNALSPDLQYYRLSLTPSLLEKVHPNIKAGYGQFALFELGKAHQVDAVVRSEKAEEDGLPDEFERLALVFAASDRAAAGYAGAAYYMARKYLVEVLRSVGLHERVVFMPQATDDDDQAATYYAPGRAAVIMCGDVRIGRIGEYSPAVTKSLKLPAYTAGFEIGLKPLSQLVAQNRYVPLPHFPKLSQDICLKVPVDTTYAEVFTVVQAAIAAAQPGHTWFTLEPVDIYQRDDDTAHKQITLRLSIASHERTLTDVEVNKLLDTVAGAAAKDLKTERI